MQNKNSRVTVFCQQGYKNIYETYIARDLAQGRVYRSEEVSEPFDFSAAFL